MLVPLDYKLTAEEQLALLAHAQPARARHRVLRRGASCGRSTAAGASRTRVLVTEAPDGVAISGARSAGSTARDRELQLRMRAREDVACIVYSSGTSGAPKGCMLTHDNYLEQAQVLGRLFPMEEERSLLLGAADQPRDRLHVRHR